MGWACTSNWAQTGFTGFLKFGADFSQGTGRGQRAPPDTESSVFPGNLGYITMRKGMRRASPDWESAPSHSGTSLLTRQVSACLGSADLISSGLVFFSPLLPTYLPQGLRKGCLLLYIISKHDNIPHLEYFIHRPFSPTLAPYPPSPSMFGYGCRSSWSAVRAQVPAGTGEQVVRLFPLLYPSIHSTAEQTDTLDVRYREGQSSRSCRGSDVTQKCWTRSKAAKMHREQEGREEVTDWPVSTAMSPEKRGTAAGTKERAGKATAAARHWGQSPLPAGRAGSWSPYQSSAYQV